MKPKPVMQTIPKVPANVEPLLAELEQKYPIRLHRYDLFNDRSCNELFDEFASRHNLSIERRYVPTIFVSDAYFVSDASILERLEETIKEILQKGSLSREVLVVERPAVRAQEAINTPLRYLGRGAFQQHGKTFPAHRYLSKLIKRAS